MNAVVDKPFRTIMIQGCTSDAGKSVLVAGLCRLLARKDCSVAPFKPQNMALNSAVTIDGGEIGRAQAVQAMACGLEPHTDFNPILLKPSNDTGAQVIVHGHPVDHMQAAKFHDYKKVAMAAVLESHSRLSDNYRTIVVEGAGSPAEINLRENDIANMGFAEAVDCPVLLIADIDRGGVFAHLTGTLELLSASEQNRVIGFVINKFRGDIKLLESGLEWLENRTGKPVLGVIPFLPSFFLDAEDAISCEQQLSDNGEVLKVVVPVVPRISNHTDFDALRMNPHVDLQFVSIDSPLPLADLIILPGSKNVLEDLKQLKDHDWKQKIDKHLRYGGKLIGICGGFQMLGKKLSDPLSIESSTGTIEGFGLLACSTSLQPEKRLKQVTGGLSKELTNRLKPSDGHKNTGLIRGYEIHCGITEYEHFNPPYFALLENGIEEGMINTDNNIIGTYIHGVFDEPSGCKAILAWAGLQVDSGIDLNLIREQQLDRLADCLSEHMDSRLIEQLCSNETQSQTSSFQ